MTSHLILRDAGLAFHDWLLWAVGLAIVAVCVRLYGRLLGRVLAGRGKVWVDPLGLPDLLVVLVLATWLGGLVVRGFSRPEASRELTESALLQGAALFGMVVLGITLFLRSRQIPVSRLFGFRRAPLFRVLTVGAGLLLAALPLVIFCTALVQWIAGKELQQQEIVEYFTDAARHSERWRVILAAAMAVLVAPATEEFIFRGYIYGVLRRYLGGIPALLLTSALFAAIHLNLPAFLPLFVLAACLTLAYEATGSLLTSMWMHALFNAIMLGGMFFVTRN